jgi:hypothetical protein
MATKLEQNRVYATRLGWKPSDFGAPVNDFSPGLVTSIELAQKFLGVSIDGVAGPATFSALLEKQQRVLLDGLSLKTGDDKLIDAGMIALYENKIWWMRNDGIFDLPAHSNPNYTRCRDFIDATIRTDVGINWAWEEPYEANTSGQGNYEWCGAYASRGWRKAGLKLTIAKDYFSSNYRLDRMARYQQINEHTLNPRPSQGPYRRILELNEKSPVQSVVQFGPRMGDLLLVGPVNSAYGKHVCMVEGFDEKTGEFITIEGNGTGDGPDGGRRHGVVRARRPVGLRPGMKPTVYHARRLIRIAPSDLI